MTPEMQITAEDWHEIGLGALATFRTGPFGSMFHKSDYVVGGTPLINPSHIVDGDIVPDETVTIRPELAKRLSVFALREGEIVIGRRGDMGRCAVVKRRHEGFLCGTGSMIVRPRPGINPHLLQALLSSPEIIAKIEENSVGTTMINLNQGTLASLNIRIATDTKEQEAIAEALSDADALIEGLERLIAKKRLIKQGAMQDLLTAKRRLPGFSGDWASKKFGEISRIRNQKIQTFGDMRAENCIELEQVESETGRLRHWTSAADRKTSKYLFQPGDVLFGRLRPYLRKYFLAHSEGVCSTEIWPLMGIGVTSSFLYHIVQSDPFVAAACESYGTHMPRADWGKVLTFELNVPDDSDEQNAIGSVLLDMDSEIQALETRLKKARHVKEGMMQNLLTGRIRLV